MYTHKILHPNTSNSNTTSLTNVQRVIYQSDSLLTSEDINLLQEVPIYNLSLIAGFITNGIYITNSGKTTIKQGTNNITIQFPGLKGYINLGVIYSFELPSIDIDIPLTLNEVTLYISLQQINTSVSDKLIHLPISMRPSVRVNELDIKYSTSIITDLINYPILRVFKKDDKYELRVINYSNQDSSHIDTNISNTSYISSGIHISQSENYIYISPGIVYIEGFRILNSNTIQISVDTQQNKDYHINMNSSYIWLSEANILESPRITNINSDNYLSSTNTITIGKIKVREEIIYYYELLSRTNPDWYSSLLTRVESISNITSTLLQSSHTNSFNNLHITNFALRADITHPDYSISYIDSKYPCSLSEAIVTPFNNLSITSPNNLTYSNVGRVTLVGTNESINLIHLPADSTSSSLLISTPDISIGMVINTPLIDIDNKALSLTSIISRFRGFGSFNIINSVKVNRTVVPDSYISLGLSGSQDLNAQNIKGITLGTNEFSIDINSNEINIPVIDNNPIYINHIPTYLVGQTFTVSNSISISHIGIYIINTEYIRELSRYSVLIGSVCVYKISGDVINNEKPYYLGEYKLSNDITNNRFTYIESLPILSTPLDSGKYVCIFIPYVHPLEVSTTSTVYTGGNKAVITGKLNILTEDIDGDIAITIKGCYVTPNITPRNITLSLANTANIYPLLESTKFEVEDSLNQLNDSNFNITTTNNRTDINIALPNQKYISLEALSLIGTMYTESGIWVSTPILLNKSNLIDLEIEILGYFPGISNVKGYISIDSSNAFIPLITQSQSNSNYNQKDLSIVQAVGLPIVVTRYIIIKLDITNDIRERDVAFIKEVLIKPIT